MGHGNVHHEQSSVDALILKLRCQFKVSVKENEVPTEKNSQRKYFCYKGKLNIKLKLKDQITL